jgi:hypothetical protein
MLQSMMFSVQLIAEKNIVNYQYVAQHLSVFFPSFFDVYVNILHANVECFSPPNE